MGFEHVQLFATVFFGGKLAFFTRAATWTERKDWALMSKSNDGIDKAKVWVQKFDPNAGNA